LAEKECVEDFKRAIIYFCIRGASTSVVFTFYFKPVGELYKNKSISKLTK